MDQFFGFHSEWNMGSPGGWDYQRITQIIGKTIWEQHFRAVIDIDLDFDHPLLHPVNNFVVMLTEAHRSREGSNPGLIAVVAEEETLEDVVENRNLVTHLNAVEGLSGALMAPHELEESGGRVCWKGQPVSIIFMDFNTDVLLTLHRRQGLHPLLRAVREGRVINPRGTEPINSKSMFEVITAPGSRDRFNEETVRRTPWTRQFYPRRTEGPRGEVIADLVEWTRSNWDTLVLKPERGYSGKGVSVGGIDGNVDRIIEGALDNGGYGGYIVQEKVPLDLWTELIPEIDRESRCVTETPRQTDFRCLFGTQGLFGFLGRYGGVPTNVGSGGGVQPLAVLPSHMSVREATDRINHAITHMPYDDVLHAAEHQDTLALEQRFTYLLGPIKIALRPRLITAGQMDALSRYCRSLWQDCLTLEQMWLSDELPVIVDIEPEEMEIIRSQPWGGSPAIFAADGLFSFGADLR